MRSLRNLQLRGKLMLMMLSVSASVLLVAGITTIVYETIHHVEKSSKELEQILKTVLEPDGAASATTVES